MNIEESDIDIFDQYILGTLTPEESIQFEDQLKNNAVLKDKFNDYKISVYVVKLTALRNEMAEIIKAKEVKSNIFGRKIVWLPVAASLLSFILFLVWHKHESVNEYKLFNTYYSPYPNLLTTRSGSNEFSFAMEAYSNRNYEMALALLNQTRNVTDTVLFYKGLCQLSISRPDSAIASFIKISPSSIYSQQVNWFIGMTYLLKKDKKSIMYFKKIKKNTFKYTEATEILKLLEE